MAEHKEVRRDAATHDQKNGDQDGNHKAVLVRPSAWCHALSHVVHLRGARCWKAKRPYTTHAVKRGVCADAGYRQTWQACFGLKANDFIIEDDGVPQQINMDEAEPEEPVSMVIAIQTGRMALVEFQRMKTISSMLDQVVGQPQVQTAIVTFDNEINLLQDFTFESAQTETYLKKMMAGSLRDMGDAEDSGGAAIYDAVRYLVELLKKQPGR